MEFRRPSDGESTKMCPLGNDVKKIVCEKIWKQNFQKKNCFKIVGFHHALRFLNFYHDVFIV